MKFNILKASKVIIKNLSYSEMKKYIKEIDRTNPIDSELYSAEIAK